MASSVVTLTLAVTVLAGSQQTPPPPPPPVPRPFPGAAAPPVASKPPATQTPQTPQVAAAAPAPVAGACGPSAPTETTLQVRVPPTAEFLESFDAGRGQCFHLYGTNDAYLDVVQYFRSLLGGGRTLFREPPMQQFELGSFDARTMAFPPAVVVKDYTWNGSEGYPFVKGAAAKRFKTVIQIVPPSPGR